MPRRKNSKEPVATASDPTQPAVDSALAEENTALRRDIEGERERSLTEREQAHAEIEAGHKQLQAAADEQAQAQLEAHEQESFIEAVLEAAEALVIVFDRQGRIVRFNAASERAAGRPLRRIRNGLIWNLIPAAQRQEVQQVFAELIAGRFPNRFENDWLRKDGTRVRVAWSNTALTDSTGTVTHVVAVGVDVTERRKAQAAQRDSEARSRALVEAAPLGIVVIDRANRIQAVNASLERMFGYERAQLLGQPLDMLLPERFRSAHQGHQKRFFRRPTSRSMGADMALFGRHKEGREFPIEVGLGHFAATGGSYAVAFVTDVSEKISAQQTIEQNRDEIRDLAARLITAQEDEQSRIARDLHDGLVQQLAALKLDLALLARNPATAEAGLLEEIRSAEAEAGRAAENARAISHQLHPAVLEQLGLAAALRAKAAEILQTTGVDVRVRAEGPAPALTREEALGLYRIAQEAAWNAVRHSGASAVDIVVRSAPDQVWVEVSDQGRGFDFADVRSRRSLGLVSIEERARLIQADLQIESRPGEGTTVRATLHLEPTT